MTTSLIRTGTNELKFQRVPRFINRHEQGVALFVGLIFLVILSLVALVAMRGTLLDMRMTSATARHEQAFEASEAAREVPELMLAIHVYNRGWPVTWGGTVSDTLFDLNTVFANRLAYKNLLNPNTVVGNGIQPSCTGSGLVSFYTAVTCSTPRSAAYNYTPATWATAAQFVTCANGTTGGGTACPSGQQIMNKVSIIRDGLSINKGSGAAQAQGYASVGVGSSKGGSALALQVRSESTVPGGGDATTIAQYKLNVTN